LELDKDISLKIIIVDDSRDDQFFIKESMRLYKNITWVSFFDGEEFLKYLESAEKHKEDSLPDIVILDINMPKLTGFEVLEVVKRRDLQESITFYILTTDITDKDREKCEKLKIDCYKKPFSLEHFSMLIQRLIVDSKK